MCTMLILGYKKNFKSNLLHCSLIWVVAQRMEQTQADLVTDFSTQIGSLFPPKLNHKYWRCPE